MPDKVQILCTYSPAPGKADQFRQVMVDLAQRVTEEQTQCLGYQVLERKTADGPSFLLFERWPNQEALDNHMKLPWLQAFDDTLDALSARPQIIEPVEIVGGYAERS